MKADGRTIDILLTDRTVWSVVLCLGFWIVSEYGQVRLVNGLDTFLRAAEAADDEILKQKTIDVNKLVLPTSYTLLEKKYGTSVKGKSQRNSRDQENDTLLDEDKTYRESLSYRETLEVIVDIPWESLERVSG